MTNQLSTNIAGKAPSEHTHDYPVDSVNGKTGTVTLSASDVGAAPTGHAHAGVTIAPLGLELTPESGATHGGFIDFHYGGSTSDHTSRIWEPEYGKIVISGSLRVDGGIEGVAASSHNHSASNITSGTLPVARGGTGATDNAGILRNLHPNGSVTNYIATFGDNWSNGGHCTPEQLRIAMGAQPALGFTPIQQGLDDGRGGNKIRIAWDVIGDGSNRSGIDITVDGTFVGKLVTGSPGQGSIVPVANGGTGATDLWHALANLGLNSFRTYYFDNCSTPLLTLQNNYSSIDNVACLIYCVCGGTYYALVGFKVDNYCAFLEIGYGGSAMYKYRNVNGTWTMHTYNSD